MTDEQQKALTVAEAAMRALTTRTPEEANMAQAIDAVLKFAKTLATGSGPNTTPTGTQDTQK